MCGPEQCGLFKISSVFAEELPPLPTWQADKLRRALTVFDGTNERLGALLDFVLQDLSALPEAEWQKAQGVSGSGESIATLGRTTP